MDLKRYHEIRLYNTDITDDRGYPVCVGIAGVELDRPRTEVRGDPATFEGHVVRVLSPTERLDVVGPNGFMDAEHCCSHCGSGLGLTSCPGCARTFRDDQGWSSTGIGVPQLARVWFEARGHDFDQ